MKKILAKIASELSFLEPIQQGKFFVPILSRKLSRLNNQYRLHSDLFKEAYAENLAKINSELSFLEPI